MNCEICDFEQGSPDWFAVRSGKVTASRFKDVLAKNVQRTGDGKTRDEYLRQIAGEIITEEPMETYKNDAMEHGSLVEPEARALYEMVTGNTVQEVGFCIYRNEGDPLDGRVGCSPDGLIGSPGGVEIKRQVPHNLILRIRDGSGTLHLPQIQGNMLVTGRKWWDVCAYYPKMPLWRFRVERNDDYINTILRPELQRFLQDADALVDVVRKYEPTE